MFIQVRRGTTAQWEASGRILLAGEWGAAIDDGALTSLRIGNGIDHWTDLPEQRGPTIHYADHPPTPSDGAVGDLWVVTAP